jgi:predicted RNA methylase
VSKPTRRTGQRTKPGQGQSADEIRAREMASVPGLAARVAAGRVITDVLSGGHALDERFSPNAVPSRIVGLDARDAGLARSIATVSLRRLGTIRHALAALLEKGLPRHAGQLEWLLIAAAHREEPRLDLSVKSDPQDWAERLGGIVLPTGSVRLRSHEPIAELPGYAEGEWWVQDAAAALPVRLLAARAGERVLDLCAAPGGKTAQIAAVGAQVTALDKSAERLRRLTENLERLHLRAEVIVADAMTYSGGPFDAILLDAPCTSTGTIRRHPDVAWTKRPGDMETLAAAYSRRAGGWFTAAVRSSRRKAKRTCRRSCAAIPICVWRRSRMRTRFPPSSSRRTARCARCRMPGRTTSRGSPALMDFSPRGFSGWWGSECRRPDLASWSSPAGGRHPRVMPQDVSTPAVPSLMR